MMRARLQPRRQERTAGIAGAAIELKARAPVFPWPLASLSAVPGLPPVQRRLAAREPDEEAPLLGVEAPEAGLADDEAEGGSLQQSHQSGPGQRRSRRRRYREMQRQNRQKWKKKHPKQSGKLKHKHKKLKREREKQQRMLSRDLRWNRKNDPGSMSVEQAIEIVRKVAAESFGGDYNAAYANLKDDPKLWAPALPQESIKSVHNKSHVKSYVYLPSLDREVPVNGYWPFDVFVPVTQYFPGTDNFAGWASYIAMSFDDVVGLGAFSEDDAAEILRNINRSGVTVTFQATIKLSPDSRGFAPGSAPAPQSRKVTGRRLKDTAKMLIPGTVWNLPWGQSAAGPPVAGNTGTNWPCQLSGSVIAVGSYKPPPEMTESHIGATKEYAVKNRVK